MFGPQGLDWQILCRGPLDIATYITYLSYVPHGYSEDNFLSFSHYKPIGTLDPGGGASLNPRGLIGRFYV